MSDWPVAYESDKIVIHEWPQPICEIYDKVNQEYVRITTPEDAKAVINSLQQFLASIPTKFGGTKE